MKREFLMLAQTYKSSKHYVGGWFLSEKLDGMRCFWDGGVTTGMPKSEVPWANHNKDSRYITLPISTGLWTRLGNVIHAPKWFTDSLPKMPLDGELYRVGHRQHLMSTVKKIRPNDADWQGIKLYAFDIPCFGTVFDTGYLNSTNFENKMLDGDDCRDLIISSGIRWAYDPFKERTFHTTNVLLERLAGENLIKLTQERLPLMQSEASLRLIKTLNVIADRGGEGVMLRNPDSVWTPERSWNLLKVKRLDDAEGTVVGYITGRETEKGSKLLGMMGALILDYEGKRLELSGFTEAERALGWREDSELSSGLQSAQQWATENPETQCPDWIQASHFPRGTKITFRYRGTSADGIPQEARYWRKHVG
jgi:DNA ligase